MRDRVEEAQESDRKWTAALMAFAKEIKEAVDGVMPPVEAGETKPAS